MRPSSERILGQFTVLRPLNVSDLPLLARWNADAEIIRWVGKKFERNSDARRWLECLLRSPRRRGFAIETPDGQVVGDLEFEDINWSAGTAELRICIGEKAYWGRGLGTDAVRTATRYAFVHWRLNTLYLRVQMSNWRAIRCYDRCGFRLEGILRAGRRRDEGWPDLLLMRLDRAALDSAERRAVT